ncbi:hypothetical protein FIM10_04105 [Sphingomonadales bacterium 56]|uniref:hypothetical protein n=1 Tax=unclassified Sphingobium TaxID=2611147 RepID=UPI0019190B78|nr:MULTISPECIES: hypothetical protein [unclassified Sphingobium]MBY2927859.1 hypothetical protein [Sphingomonadales bacterium 56]MBY2957959.1 hypothetical protein [Sphingomonadales bacterium 58]CAD7336084.1 hypothetical protein SPHS6_00833 [Sphingobium sp. S6]CAD7336147.1 hypothetical protein SPHS8_00873 [Sphingobium sp. S8]
MAKPTRPSIPDQLERASFEFDLLIRDARNIRHARDYDALEERAQAIAASIVAPFRGSWAPSAPPLWIETRGDKSSALF